MIPDRNERLESEYRHGSCYVMAGALADLLPDWRFEVLVVDLAEGSGYGSGEHPVHAWVASPAMAAQGIGLDAGGPFLTSGLYGEFLDGLYRKRWSSWRIETVDSLDGYLALLKRCMGRQSLFDDFMRKLWTPDMPQARQAAIDYVLPRLLGDLIVPETLESKVGQRLLAAMAERKALTADLLADDLMPAQEPEQALIAALN